MSFERAKFIQQFNKDKVKLGKDISAGEKQTGKRSLWASLGGMIGSELLMWGATTALTAATGGTAAAALKFIFMIAFLPKLIDHDSQSHFMTSGFNVVSVIIS